MVLDLGLWLIVMNFLGRVYVVDCYEMFWVGCMLLIVMKCLYNVVYVGGCEGSGFRGWKMGKAHSN